MSDTPEKTRIDRLRYSSSGWAERTEEVDGRRVKIVEYDPRRAPTAGAVVKGWLDQGRGYGPYD